MRTLAIGAVVIAAAVVLLIGHAVLALAARTALIGAPLARPLG